jgi:hypothetical protein
MWFLSTEGKKATSEESGGGMWCKIHTAWDQPSSELASSIEIWTVQYAGRVTFHVTELFVTWPRSALKKMKWKNVCVAVV